MALNLNTGPYYDDFDSAKNFNRILFKPGYAVQARELTQLQTILQNQIARFGEHIFVDGAPVLGCKDVLQNYDFVKINDVDNLGSAISNDDLATYVGDTVTGGTSGNVAVIAKVKSGQDTETIAKKTVYIQYTSGDNSDTDSKFVAGEVLTVTSTVSGRNGNTFVVDSNTSIERNKHYRGQSIDYSVQEGLIYFKGKFVEHSTQSIQVAPFGSPVTKYVGVLVKEDIVTSDDDSTLLDPATGTFNFNAPGADRYKVYTELVTRDPATDTIEDNFVSLFKVVDGKKSTSVIDEDLKIYGLIGDRLAERTYLESGHYSIKNYKVEVREHLLDIDDDNGGLVEGGSSQHIAVGVSDGKAVIRGRVNEVYAPNYFPVRKGNDTRLQESITTSTVYGNYVRVNNMAGEWDINTSGLVNFGTAPLNANMSNTGILSVTAISAAESLRLEGIYLINAGDYTTGASGSDARFIVRVSAAGAASVEIIEGGTGFIVNETITIPDARLGNGGAPNLTFDAATLGTSRSSTFGAVAPPASLIGTARVRHVAKESGTPGDPEAVYRLYLYDIKMSGGALRDVRSVYFDSATTNFNGAGDVLFDNNAGSPLIFNQKRNVMVFQMPVKAMKSIAVDPINTYDNTFTFQKEIDATFTTTGTSTISVSGTQSFPYSTTPSQSQLDDEFIMVFKEAVTIDGTAYAAGEIFDIQESHIVTAGPASIQFDIGTSLSNTADAKLYVKVKQTDTTPVPLSALKSRFVKIDTATNSEGASGPWNLGICNTYKIEGVFVGDAYSDTTTNFSEQFEFFNGQTDNYYGHSKLIKNNTSVDTTNKKILVKLSYLDPNYAGSQSTYFAVDSYPADELTAVNPNFYTYEIPIHQAAGKYNVDLRDAIDFRPYIENTASDATTIGTASENPSSDFNLRSVSGGYQFPMPRETYSTDGEYWLGRVDRIVIDENGLLSNVEGQPKATPVPPIYNPGVMLISDLYIPPYPSIPYDLARRYKRLDLAVRTDVKQNRRYTMQDIASIEKRIGRLEYYSSLNFIQSSTADKTIPDANGLDRFKNGFFVDTFTNHDLMNVNDIDLNFGIDDRLHEGGPIIKEDHTDLEYNSVLSSNTAISGNLITLPYTTQVFSSNLVASKPRNCIGELLFNYTGDMRVWPTSDTNRDPDSSPTPNNIVLQGSANALTNAFNNLGNAGVTNSVVSMGGSTDQTTTSTATSTSSATFVDTGGFEATVVEADPNDTNSAGEPLGDTVIQTADVVQTATTTTTTTSELTVSSSTLTQTNSVLSVNTNNNFSDYQEGSFTAVTDVQFSNFLRQRQIFVEATRLKPNTRYYLFFDGVSDAFRVRGSTNFSTTARIRQIGLSWFDGLSATQKLASYGTSSLPGSGSWNNGYVTSDSTGRLVLQLKIPPNRYRVGNKILIISDDIKNRQGFVTSSCAGQYSSFVNSTLESSTLNLSTQVPNITMGYVSAGTTTIGTVTTGVSLSLSSESSTEQTSTNINEQFEIIPGAEPDPADPPPDPVDPPATVVPPEVTETPLPEIVFEWEGFDMGLFGSFGIDPIAQTFFVNNGHGIFLKELDVYFRTKSSTNSITMQIREVVNGYPGSLVIPYGNKNLLPSQVNISEDASTATTFSFDEPIYLAPNKEFCFVLLPQGNDPDYNIWVSELGQNKLGTTERIQAEDSSTGVLFVSSNNRSWNAIQAEDIKYSLKRCKFSPIAGKAVFNNEDYDYLKLTDFTNGFFANTDSLHAFDITLTNGGSGYALNDVITLASFGSGTGATLTVTAETSGVVTAFSIGEMGSSYAEGDYSPIAQSSTTGVGSGLTVDITVKTGSVVEFRNKTTACKAYVDANSTFAVGDVLGTGSTQATITAIENRSFNRLFHNFTDMLPSQNSTITYEVFGTKPSGVAIPGNIGLPIGRATQEFTKEEYAIYSKSNESLSLSGAKSFKVEAVLRTPSDLVSPVIDISRAGFDLFVNDINNVSTNEESRNGGDATCRYISRIVQLTRDNLAEDLRVYMDQRVPNDASVEVYAKFRAAEDDGQFRDDLYWVKLETNNLSALPPGRFVEIEYKVPLRNSNLVGLGGDAQDTLEYITDRVSSTSITAGGSGYTSAPTVIFSGGGAWKQATGIAQISAGAVVGITITDPGRGYTSAPTIAFSGGGGTGATATATTSTITFTRYKDFAIKVVLKAGNTSEVPAIKNLRAIAMQA